MEVNVHVIEQPFDWYGEWKGFMEVDGVYGDYVENENCKLIKVDKNLVYESESNMLIYDYINNHINNIGMMTVLKEYGLTKDDSENFIALMKKITVSEEGMNSFNEMMEDTSSIPFEGGAMFCEAIILLKETMFS